MSVRDVDSRTMRSLAEQLPGLHAEPNLIGVTMKAMAILDSFVESNLTSSLIFNELPGGQLGCGIYDAAKNQRTPQEQRYYAEVGFALMDENPFLNLPIQVRSERSIRSNELMSDRKMRHTAMYREFLHPQGVYRQMLSTIPMPGGFLCFGTYRDGGAFSDRDFAIIEVLRRHLLSLARKHIQKGEEHRAVAMFHSGAEHRSLGVVALDASSLCIHHANPQASHLLRRIGFTLVHNRLPQKLESWLITQRDPNRWLTGKTPQGLQISHEGGAVEISYVEHAAKREIYVILSEIAAPPIQQTLRTMGLTPREAEIMRWIAEGKSSPEIALILRISPSTVDKHAERILGKLGVENRTAAIAAVRQL